MFNFLQNERNAPICEESQEDEQPSQNEGDRALTQRFCDLKLSELAKIKFDNQQ